MSNYPLVKFVDGPSAGATVRLDLNDSAATAPRRVEADFDLGAPTIEGDPDAVGQVFGLRSPRFTVQIKGTKANALAFVSALSKEMLRRTNWVMFQLSSATSPVWFKVYRTGYQPLSLDQVFGNTATGGAAPAGFPDTWRVEVPLVADAFAYGARVTHSQVQVVQGPIDLTGPVRTAMRVVLPAIKGDAPTGLRVQVVPASGTTGNWLVGCVSGSASMVDPVVDIGTGDGFTAGTGTAAGAANAADFTGSCRTVTIAANDLTTGSNFAQRLTGTIAGLRPGRYKALVRYEADAPISTVKNYIFAFGRPRNSVAVYGATKTISLGTAGSGVTAFSQGWVDLGEFQFPSFGTIPDDFSATTPAQTFYLKIGNTDNSTGTVRIDAFKLIPVSGKDVTTANMLTASSLIAGATSVFDTDTESFLATSGGAYVDTSVVLAGGFPVADPGAAQNLLELVCLGGLSGSAHFTTGMASLNAQSAIDVSYYPRYLHVGDGT